MEDLYYDDKGNSYTYDTLPHNCCPYQLEINEIVLICECTPEKRQECADDI